MKPLKKFFSRTRETNAFVRTREAVYKIDDRGDLVMLYYPELDPIGIVAPQVMHVESNNFLVDLKHQLLKPLVKEYLDGVNRWRKY